MRKLITIALLAMLVVATFGAPSATAKKKAKGRVANGVYDNPAIGSGDLGGGCLGCPSFGSTSSEHSVMVEITDQTGLPVPASVSWDADGDGISETGFEVCGKTEAPEPIDGGQTLNVFVWAIPSSSCPTGTATSGTVKMTFFK